MIRKSILKKLKISKEIKDYIEILIKNNIKPEKVVLFGSFAQNKPRRYSDIDLAIISPHFAKDPVEASMRLMKLSNEVSDRIEPIALTPKEMESKYQTLIGEIKKYGKIVYPS